MENRIQEQTHHNDRFVFAKFVNEEACRECKKKKQQKWNQSGENVSEIAARCLETASSVVWIQEFAAQSKLSTIWLGALIGS